MCCTSYRPTCKRLTTCIVKTCRSFLSTFQSLKGSSRGILLRSVFSKSADLCLTITNKFPKASLRFVWLPAAFNISDLNSKVQTNIIEATNSDKWRKGPHQFKSQQFMENNVYARFDKKNKSLYYDKEYATNKGCPPRRIWSR